ncbi:copper radical oxidase [Dendrothele bispora CBS 962.96]|uniref:Copper radical oxidase n=1 Tax=Dendrothele bispora (strain CBS 962.96) TaxID=1314807 RepID=A0A4S8LFU9_DENBC|nr:copper radical oxidase [Dendrothele bispora CBS 962.96]
MASLTTAVSAFLKVVALGYLSIQPVYASSVPQRRQSLTRPNDLPAGWSYAGCWVDNAHGRIIENTQPGNSGLTVESCIATCAGQGFSVAGMEFADECYCGNRFVNGATEAQTDTDCNMACAGNAGEPCGGPNRLSVYSSLSSIPSLPVPTVQTTNLPGNFAYSGCFTDVVNGVRALPWQIIWEGNNTAVACMNQCAAFGYPVSATEFGQECYCGDTEDLTENGSTKGADSECTIQCPGDPIHICGGVQRMTTYTWSGSLNVWHQPQNTGFYEFFVPGLMAPLLATLGVNNKVAFLEKAAGTSAAFPNSTGAYELDLSLVGDFSREWREMHTKTDIFCSGSVILPDRAGRQINVGGWSLQSTFGVRLYTPDGSAGVNGTNDWEENGDILKLQRQRWYPTAAILANGSVLVIGGEIGSNDKPEPNLEILPKPVGGDTVVNLDWLLRTDPNNLYPFVTVLPSGNVFVAYYNEARILNPNTFDTIKTLPNMPGNVNNFLAGRTYPLEGAMVLFPQHFPYTDPLRVLICGGSTPGPAFVSDNCVSIAPEDPNPVWTIERMPSQRVMSCMVPLPDGTFMIMNGAKKGVAGFGLASDPNLNALLYDPTLPTNQRISILGNTIVARMYHSEAILLPDGSVLISGSDPETPGLPEETRIERYVPPYLNNGITPPSFTISNHDWAYGQTVTISNVRVTTGSISGVRVSLIAAVSSTHGNAMGARTIFPQFNCAGTTCTITAPPNANISPPGWHQLFILDGSGTPSHSSWVRIGGDPSQLGNWPDLPGFTRPGVGAVTIPL